MRARERHLTTADQHNLHEHDAGREVHGGRRHGQPYWPERRGDEEPGGGDRHDREHHDCDTDGVARLRSRLATTNANTPRETGPRSNGEASHCASAIVRPA